MNDGGHGPLVSVVVVSLDQERRLGRCLASLGTQTYGRLETVLVDNGGREGLMRALTTEFPAVRCLRPGRNVGFGAGVNRGIAAARGDYIALINDDATADPAWVASLVAVAEARPDIGAVASIVIDGNAPERLDSCGMGLALDGMARQLDRGRPVPRLEAPREVLLFSGCACLLRREALNEVGLFDEDFFAYCEDTDLSLRLQRAGWKIVVAPGSYVRHDYSMTGGKFSLAKVYWVERNHFWAAAKSFPWFLLLALPWVTLWRYGLQAALILSGRGRDLNAFAARHPLRAITRTYLQAVGHMLRGLPRVAAKRRRNPAAGRTGGRALAAAVWRHRLPLMEILRG